MHVMGTLTGKTVSFGAYRGYLSNPPRNNVRRGVGLLIFADIMGIYDNSHLLADEFARYGYACLLVDVSHGGALELNIIMSGSDIKG